MRCTGEINRKRFIHYYLKINTTIHIPYIINGVKFTYKITRPNK